MEPRDLDVPTRQFHAYQRPTAVPHRERRPEGWRSALETIERAIGPRAQAPAVDWGRNDKPRRRRRGVWQAALAATALVLFLNALRGRDEPESDVTSL